MEASPQPVSLSSFLLLLFLMDGSSLCFLFVSLSPRLSYLLILQWLWGILSLCYPLLLYHHHLVDIGPPLQVYSQMWDLASGLFTPGVQDVLTPQVNPYCLSKLPGQHD